jgi:hypothetical protein
MRRSPDGVAGSVRRAGRTASRPRLERLEERQLLATFTVTSPGDSGAGTLRDAINQANSNGGADIIDFNIGGSGLQLIAPHTPLPDITGETKVKGFIQGG